MKLYHVLTLLGVAVALPGCVSAPYGMSLDRHNFGSSIQHPKTVNLIDATDGEVLWSKDVPVGETLVVDLYKRSTWTQSEWTGAEPAERMKWGLFETGTMFGLLREKVDLPGNPVYLQVEMREMDETGVEHAEAIEAEEPPLPDAELERVEADADAEPADDAPPADAEAEADVDAAGSETEPID